jgi:nucleoside-diphosphate-sugar epimerase
MKLASLSNKRVLITGASGFTGIHLVEALTKLDNEIVALAHIGSSNEDAIKVDLNDKEKLKNILVEYTPDYVVHLAAISFVGHKNDLAFYDVNVLGTQNLLDAICELGTKKPKVLIASSANVYGALEKEYICESESCEPVNHYAISKLAMEKLVATYFDKLDIIITRPFNYSGVHQAGHFLIPKIVDHFRENKAIIKLGNIDVSRDYSSVDFVVEAYIRLLASNISSEIINICSGRLISLNDIISEMMDITGNKIKVEINPEFVRRNEIKLMSGNNSKLLSIVGHIEIEPFRSLLNNMYNHSHLNEDK